jgi:hypothetical protein
MAGNQSQQRSTNENKLSRSKVSLADALSATQQHTVPVLPAADASSANSQFSHTHSSAAPTDGRQSPARSRKTPKQGGSRDSRHRTTREQAAPHARMAPPGHEDSPQVTLEPPLGGSEMAHSQALAELVLQDVIQDAISMEKATRVLPELDTSVVAAQERTRAVVDLNDAMVAATTPAEEEPAIFIRGAHKPPRYNYARVVPRRQESRSLVIQFIVAMLSVMVLFSIFTAASPLGKSIASLGFVEAYANAIPWVPTATPKPKPKPASVNNPPPGANPGTQAIINEINSVFGAYSQGAISVARCESGLNPNAYNPYAIGNSHAEGVFQILYPNTWDTTAYANYSPYDANFNIHAAYQIFARDGNSWREWACQP